MTGLTRSQRKVLEFVHACLRDTGVPPSFEEIASHLGVTSKSNAHRIVCALERRGYIKRIPNLPRSLEVMKLPPDVGTSPVGAVTLKPEILTLTDRYASAHGISRDTAANELLRIALGAAA